MKKEELQELASKVGGEVAESGNALTLTVSPENVKEACRLVSSLPGFYHLSTATGIDNGESIELLYHFWKGRSFVSVRTSLPRDSPSVESASGVVPAAVLYEAEIHDLLGVMFTGNPLMGKKLLLPDNYPKDAPPPLRKEANVEEIRRMMGLE